ncbi:MAG TPA: VanZ family protein [Bryobacteraceae bacterium]
MTRPDAGKAAIALLLWVTAAALVSTSELLPGDSAAMRWLGMLQISDKLIHFAAYTLLAFIPCFGFRWRTGIALAGLSIVLGVALEFAQRLVPGRSFEVADMLANALGVATGGALGMLVRRAATARGRELAKSKAGQ